MNNIPILMAFASGVLIGFAFWGGRKGADTDAISVWQLKGK